MMMAARHQKLQGVEKINQAEPLLVASKFMSAVCTGLTDHQFIELWQGHRLLLEGAVWTSKTGAKKSI